MGNKIITSTIMQNGRDFGFKKAIDQETEPYRPDSNHRLEGFCLPLKVLKLHQNEPINSSVLKIFAKSSADHHYLLRRTTRSKAIVL